MKPHKPATPIISAIALLLVFVSTTLAAPLGTAFTYQGQLADGGNPANGSYDLTSTLYDDASGGSPVAGPLTNSPVAVSNGLFTVALDFGAVFDGNARWLEIGVRTNASADDFTVLMPRQPLTAAPYAFYAPSAGTAASVSIPPGMVLIAAGSFTMGDTLDGIGDATPVSATLSAFYMDVNEVSWSQWQSVYHWATNHGYGFVHAGSGKAANHPVQTVDWYDCVKWCNARSEQAGKTPVYYTDAGLTQVYTNGEVTVYANWSAKGYRLPTEAEWEKAARGGLSGQRFPWGLVINQNLANYYGATGSYSYDLGPNGYHPLGNYPTTSPGTSPVGSFAPNGYGLYDMAGNVREWCWDWYGTPYAGGSDPHGPAGPLSLRVLRGGVWDGSAYGARCADRDYVDYPDDAFYSFGFRCVRGL